MPEQQQKIANLVTQSQRYLQNGSWTSCSRRGHFFELPVQFYLVYSHPRIGEKTYRLEFSEKLGDLPLSMLISDVMRCVIWYPFYNLKNLKNTHGGVLLLVLQTFGLQLTKSNTPPWVSFTLIKLCRWYQIAQNITDVSTESCKCSEKHLSKVK